MLIGEPQDDSDAAAREAIEIMACFDVEAVLIIGQRSSAVVCRELERCEATPSRFQGIRLSKVDHLDAVDQPAGAGVDLPGAMRCLQDAQAQRVLVIAGGGSAIGLATPQTLETVVTDLALASVVSRTLKGGRDDQHSAGKSADDSEHHAGAQPRLRHGNGDGAELPGEFGEPRGHPCGGD